VEWLALAFNHPIGASGWIEKWPLLARLRIELEQALGSQDYQAAWERGRVLDADVVAGEVRDMSSGLGSADTETAPQPQESPLNERELAILRLAGDGLPNRDIAERLYLAPTTVKWYLSEIYSKLGVKGRVQAISRARALHLLL
jgi:ATP/maltotriose-dependent transcriptional regulator MalT